MRHHLSGRQLSRNSAHRKALLRNMAAALLRHGTIRTTLPKAKELRRVVEPLITLGKNDSLAGRRRAFSQLRDAQIVTRLFEEIGPRFRDRAGGYTRILKMEPRPGDAAPMALMQLVEEQVATHAEAPERAPAKKVAKKKAAPKKAAPKKAAAKKSAGKKPGDDDDKPTPRRRKKKAAAG